jgi:hypothetical protein
MLVAVAAAAIMVMWVIIKTSSKQQSTMSLADTFSQFEAEPSAFNDTNASDVAASIKPIDTATIGRSTQVKQAYHYDVVLDRWTDIVASANAEFQQANESTPAGRSLGRRIAAASVGPYRAVPVHEVPTLAIGALSQALLKSYNLEASHDTVVLELDQVKRADVDMDIVQLSFLHCVHAPGKSHGLCASGVAVLVVPISGLSREAEGATGVRIVRVEPRGVISEDDIDLLRSSWRHSVPSQSDMPAIIAL